MDPPSTKSLPLSRAVIPPPNQFPASLHQPVSMQHPSTKQPVTSFRAVHPASNHAVSGQCIPPPSSCLVEGCTARKLVTGCLVEGCTAWKLHGYWLDALPWKLHGYWLDALPGNWLLAAWWRDALPGPQFPAGTSLHQAASNQFPGTKLTYRCSRLTSPSIKSIIYAGHGG